MQQKCRRHLRFNLGIGWVKISLLRLTRKVVKSSGWVDVIMFDSAINESQQQLLSQALSNTSILREAIFLFSRKKLIQLHDIPPKGIWISLLGERHGKSVFRVLVQTRIQ